MIKTALQDIITLCVKTSKGGAWFKTRWKYFLSKVKQSTYFKLEIAPKPLPNTCISWRKDVPRDLVFGFLRVSRKLFKKIVAGHPI